MAFFWIYVDMHLENCMFHKLLHIKLLTYTTYIVLFYYFKFYNYHSSLKPLKVCLSPVHALVFIFIILQSVYVISKMIFTYVATMYVYSKESIKFT